MPIIVREPIYQQVGSQLRDLIRGEAYQNGDRFLSEREVAEKFGISRITANKAIAALVGEGLLEHRRGIGNFVRPSVLGYDLRGLVSFTAKAKSSGLEPSTQVLSFGRFPISEVDELMLEMLGVTDVEEVIAVERLRLVNGKPVIYERRWIRASRCPRLTEEDAAGSLYEAFTHKCGLPLTGTSAKLRAVNLGQKEAQLLGCRFDAAAFLLSAVGYSGESLWYEETLYRGDSYDVNHVLGGFIGTINQD